MLNISQRVNCCIFLLEFRRKFEAIRQGRYKLVVGMDDTYQVGWHPRYKGKDFSLLKQPDTLPGAIMRCGVWDKSKMCDSSKGKACLFDLEKGKNLRCLTCVWPPLTRFMNIKIRALIEC